MYNPIVRKEYYEKNKEKINKEIVEFIKIGRKLYRLGIRATDTISKIIKKLQKIA